MTKYYDSFCYPAPSEAFFPGEACNSPAEAIGNVVMDFAHLDDRLSISISFLIGSTEDVGAIITAEVSFKQKLHILASLFRSKRPGSDYEAAMIELVGLLEQAEGLRNQVMHSSWLGGLSDKGHGEGSIVRRKFTAKMRRGLHRQEESLTLLQILHIGNHFSYLGHCVDELLYSEFGSEYADP